MLSNSLVRRILSTGVLLVFSLTWGSGLVLAAQQDSKEVTPSGACRAVQAFVDRLAKHEEGWRHDSLGQPVVLLGLSQQKTAYLVPLLRDGDPFGYVIVSATKDKMPILEASLSSLPFNRVDQAREAATGVLKAGERLGEARYLYLGALAYVIEIPVLSENKELRSLYYDPEGAQLLQVDKSGRLLRGHQPSDPAEAASR